jgi:hypothetical protein
MTTNPKYHVEDIGVTTTMEINSLWYLLMTRLFQIAGKSPPPLQPNTNPYLVYLNPMLNLNFGTIWTLILENAFQESYTTGHLPPIRLANLTSVGVINPDISQFTDFDDIVVNDNMNLQYQSVAATIDRLVTSALFNSNNGLPFLAEYRLDIGDYPYGSWPNTVPPNLPTLSVMLFDPIHSILGNGNNRTGLTLGDGSIFTNPDGTQGTAGNSPNPANPNASTYYAPMPYVEFGVVDGYNPIDSVIYSEGDNIVSIDLTYDYISMNNSWVLTGGSFQGSDVVALPIENQRSIAEFGLKQSNQPLQNVVDPGEIQRYVGTSISFFQHPIPNIVLKPDYTYASSHVVYPGDYITVNAPSLAGVLEDSNGQLLTAASSFFTARVKTIDISWDAENGEDISLTLTFPVVNVSLADWPTGLQDSNGGAMQFMYTTVAPSARTVIGRSRQDSGASLNQSGGDFITNKSGPFVEIVNDTSVTEPDVAFLPIPMFAQIIPNNMTCIDSQGNSVKGDDVLIYQFLVEVNSSSSSDNAENVWMTVLQPDGLTIYDDITPLGQQINILSLISKSHRKEPLALADGVTPSTPLLSELSGMYDIVLHNTSPFPWCPKELFSGLPAPSLSGGVGGGLVAYIYCPVDASGHEFGMSYAGYSYYIPGGGGTVHVTWSSVPGASSYNLYSYLDTTHGLTPNPNTIDILGFAFLLNTGTNTSFNDNGSLVGKANTQPFDNSYTTDAFAFNVTYSDTTPNYQAYEASPASFNFKEGHYYWYVITAVNPNGTETECSQANTPFNRCNSNTNDNTNANGEPDGQAVVQHVQAGTTTTGTNATVMNDTTESWGTNSLIGFSLVYADGPAMGLSEVILSNTATSVTTNAFSIAPDNSGDTYLITASIQLFWPVVPYAQSYNVYRADGGTSISMPTDRATYFQLASGLTTTNFLDDGSYPNGDSMWTSYGGEYRCYTPTVASSNTYSVYVAHSFTSNPANTKTVSALDSNPSTAITVDPSQRRVYQTYPFVAP